MAKVLINDSTLSNMADEIRTQKGTQNTMTPDEMVTEVANIGGNTTATAGDITSGKTAITASGTTTGTNDKNASTELILTNRYSDSHGSTSFTSDFLIRNALKRLPPNIELDSRVTSLESTFKYAHYLLEVPSLDTTNVTSFKSTFQGCSALTALPLYNTQNTLTMAYMCSGCYALADVPQLNTNKVTTMQKAFESCYALSNNSLNNILAMCANTTTAYTATKTLTYIGLSSTQRTTCQSLSNYQDFLDAGWTL